MLIEQGRAAVLAAFHHQTIPWESPVSYFAGQHRPKAARHKRPALVPNTVKATATLQPKFSSPALPGCQVITGRVHRAISELDPLGFLWVQYRYRAPGVAKATHGQNFIRALAAAYEADGHLAGCRAGTRRVVRYLISVAMERYPRQSRHIIPDGVDVDRRNWNKTYRPHWRRLFTMITVIDVAALEQIGQKIAESGPIA